MKKISFIVSLFIAFMLGIGSDILITKYLDAEETVPTNAVLNEVIVKEENSLKSSLDKIYDAVVVIETYDKRENSLSTGSGFIYKKDDAGYIITNHHVVSGASSVKVININDEEIEATILGTDEYLDIAILKIDANYVPAVATFGSSTNLELGDTLYTVGSPLGIKYKGTVTKGILSGKDRKVTVNISTGSYVMEVLQTDAAINPGNSGGPLVNINGEVIGVNSLKLVQDEIEGMGFAIPIELVINALEQLEQGKSIERPVLGVSVLDLDDNYLLYKYGLNLSNRNTEGIVIASIHEGYPADNKLQKGDIITYIDEYKIEDSATFKYVLYKYKIGDTIKIKYIRDGKESSVDILLDTDMMDN